MPQTKHVRLAVAQVVLREGPRDSAGFRDSGGDIRRLMREAREAGATLVHFPESAICLPDKYILCGGEPAEAGPANWELFAWDVLSQELTAIAELARETGAVDRARLGSSPDTARQHNSLYVISDRGQLVTRYDEHMLSNTKINYMYTPGAGTRTFTVNGLRFGLLLGMEVHFPELFLEQERLNVDCVLFSTHNDDEFCAAEALGHAATNSYWVGYAAPARGARSGVASPAGHWEARCPESGEPGLAIVDLDGSQENPARRWRRTARSGIYEPHTVRNDSRSDDLHVFQGS